MPYHRAHMAVHWKTREKGKKWEQKVDREGRRGWSLGTRVAEKRDRGGQGLPFIREHSEYAVHRSTLCGCSRDHIL